ncbi:hypothetical protein J6590_051564 [Homalodisca vitripennis]|nr:hypothetical protein J6590_051564 [Homalodisca vitripennis]
MYHLLAVLVFSNGFQIAVGCLSKTTLPGLWERTTLPLTTDTNTNWFRCRTLAWLALVLGPTVYLNFLHHNFLGPNVVYQILDEIVGSLCESSRHVYDKAAVQFRKCAVLQRQVTASVTSFSVAAVEYRKRHAGSVRHFWLSLCHKTKDRARNPGSKGVRDGAVPKLPYTAPTLHSLTNGMHLRTLPRLPFVKWLHSHSPK